MIHITRAKNREFMQVTVGDNHKLLSQSETEKRRDSIWRNILAEAKQYNSHGDFFVQDDTPKTPIVYRVNAENGDVEPTQDVEPIPRYVPGRNPKKKKK